MSAGRRLLCHALPQIQRAEQLWPHVSLCTLVLENREFNMIVSVVHVNVSVCLCEVTASITAASGGRSEQQHPAYKKTHLQHSCRSFFDSDHKPCVSIKVFCLYREQPQWSQDFWRTSRWGWRTAEQWLIELWRQGFFFFLFPFSEPLSFLFWSPFVPPGMGVFIRGHFSHITATALYNKCLLTILLVYLTGTVHNSKHWMKCIRISQEYIFHV